jgi:hypothetical protein
MSTLSSPPVVQTESTDRLGGNTLIMIGIGFIIFCFIDFLRGVEFSRDTAMVNGLGTFFIATPLMMTVAARNIARWSVSEYLGLTLVSVMLVVMIGFPVAATSLGMLHTSTEVTGMSARALARFEGFSAISAVLSFVAFGAFVIYGTRARVWTAHQRDPLSF